MIKKTDDMLKREKQRGRTSEKENTYQRNITRGQNRIIDKSGMLHFKTSRGKRRKEEKDKTADRKERK